jgi:hypothetical protein
MNVIRKHKAIVGIGAAMGVVLIWAASSYMMQTPQNAPQRDQQPPAATVAGEGSLVTMMNEQGMTESEIGTVGPDRSFVTSGLPLPPPGTPLKEEYEELSRRAKAGDDAASCRLSADLWRCSQLPKGLAIEDQALTRAAQMPATGSVLADAVDDAVKLRMQVSEDEKRCEGFEVPSPHAAWDFLLMAAERGNVRAMAQLAIAPPLDEQDFLQSVDEWQKYRRVAGKYLKRAAAAGDPFALYNLWWAYAGYPGPGGTPVITPNTYLARVYAHALANIGDSKIVATMQRYLQQTQASVTSSDDARARDDGLSIAKVGFAHVRGASLHTLPSLDGYCDDQRLSNR